MAKIVIQTFVFCFISFSSLIAQKEWSLDKCIDYAFQNSLSIKQAELNIEDIRLAEKLNKMERMPDLNADISAGYSFGRTIDPITNSFKSQSIGTNSVSLGASVVLYNGGRIHTQIKKSKIDLAAQKANALEIANNISLEITRAYISILIGEEQLQNALKQLEQTKDQLKQTERLIRSGVLPDNDKLLILVQIAQQEQFVIVQENNIDIAYLNLRNILLIDDDEDFRVVTNPKTSSDPNDLVIEPLDFTMVYDQALQNQPIIQLGELSKKSADLDVSIAKSGLLPTLVLFGNIRSDYGSSVQDITKPNLEDATLELGESQAVNIDGQDVALAVYQTQGIRYPDRSYFNQLNDNFGQSVGLSLRIPIYNKDRNKVNIQRARLNLINAEIVNKQNKQLLKTNIQRSITDVRTAEKQLEASKKSVKALEVAYKSVAKKFSLGAANTFELTSAKNSFDQAKYDLTIAKYDYFYKVKIIEFYKGKKLSSK